jgi:hypothetical protein
MTDDTRFTSNEIPIKYVPNPAPKKFRDVGGEVYVEAKAVKASNRML